MTLCDSLIFDMDGTLWDGVECYAQGFNDFFAAQGLARRVRKEEITGLMGLEERAFLAATLPEWPETERGTLYQQVVEFQYRRVRSDGGILYPGVREGLEALAQEFPLFIVSNCPAHMIEHFVAWAGIGPWIRDSLAHGTNYRAKHENIRLLMELHRLQAPIYIGDTDSDRKQAALVPIPFLYVDYGFGHAESYDLKASSFAEVVEAVGNAR